jgi:hypothetical protein
MNLLARTNKSSRWPECRAPICAKIENTLHELANVLMLTAVRMNGELQSSSGQVGQSKRLHTVEACVE